MKYILLIFLSFSLFAQEKLSIVAVGEAEEEKDIIAITTPFLEGFKENKFGEENAMYKVWKNDFSFYKHKFIVKEVKTVKNVYGEPDFLNWKAQQFRFVITSKLVNDEKAKVIRLNVKVFDTVAEKDIYNHSDIFKTPSTRSFYHQLANDMFVSITGKKSIFTSKIFFVSDKLSTKRKIIKELYMMDFDGRNIERLTNHRSIVISPSVSNDNSKVLYSVIKIRNSRQNVDLYMIDVNTKKISLISAKKGINSGGVFSGDDTKIYLTLSYTGNADIYELDLSSGALRRITKHFADDVDPSITADGSMMSMLSGRPGKAMIYTLDPRGTEKSVKRISYVGKFNATPVYSPDGKDIAFASWVDNRFDIYRIGSNGRNLVRLTKNFGSNEEPSYSKDGEFIAFASQRVLSRKKAIQNLYIMTRDGEILGNITNEFGACTSPRWSK